MKKSQKENDTAGQMRSELARLRKRIAELEKTEAESRKLQQSLEESEEKYHSLVENLNVGIFRTELGIHGKILYGNPAVLKMFGYASMDEIIRLQVAELYRDPEQRRELVNKLKKRGFIKEKEAEFVRKDGSVFLGSITSSVQCDKDKKPLWINGILEDITAKKIAEEKLRQALAEIKKLSLTDELTGLSNRRGFITLAQKTCRSRNA
jgi:PAS domain S-box-containing protein